MSAAQETLQTLPDQQVRTVRREGEGDACGCGCDIELWVWVSWVREGERERERERERLTTDLVVTKSDCQLVVGEIRDGTERVQGPVDIWRSHTNLHHTHC